MNDLSKYITDDKTHEGYCQICEKHGRLKKDHVPPKAWRAPNHVEYVTSLESISSNNIVRQRAYGGVYFRTICEHCNSVLLGSIDNVFKEVCSQIIPALSIIKRGGILEHPYIVNCNTTELVKAAAGHILAAVKQSDCASPPQLPNLLLEMKEFLLGFKSSFEHIEVRIWPYSNKKEVYVSRFQASSYLKQRGLNPECYSTIACYPFGITFRFLNSNSQTLMTKGQIVHLNKNHLKINLYEKIPKNYGIGLISNDHIIMGYGEDGYHGNENIKY